MTQFVRLAHMSHIPLLFRTRRFIITARHAMHSADYAVERCLSVCLYQTRYDNNPTETPLTGRRMQGRGMRNRNFRQISRIIYEMIQDRAIVTMEGS